jgi:prepilin signal peptidase PulO-like enzyme (type II secretory pathway)
MVIPFIFAALGLAVGSFGNVLILRLQSGESFGGRSRCMSCRRTLSWFELIPVLSYSYLLGKCRTCHAKISIQYPLVEAASALLFVFAVAVFPQNLLQAAATGVLLSFLLFACVFDARFQRIPDLFTIVIGIAALITVLCHGAILSSLFGAIVPFVWFGAQWVLSRGRYVGTGDIYLGAVLGFWLGFIGSIEMLMLSYIIGALTVLILLLMRAITFKKNRIAFAPFLATGAFLVFFGVRPWDILFPF